MDIGAVKQNFTAPDKWAAPVPEEMFVNVKVYQEAREALELVAQVLPQMKSPDVGQIIDVLA